MSKGNHQRHDAGVPPDDAGLVRTATMLWAAITAGPILMGAVIGLIVRSRGESEGGLSAIAAYVAVGISVLAAVVTPVLLPRLAPARPGATPGNLLMSRTFLGGAIGEGAALLCCAVYLFSGAEAALGGVVVFIAAQITRRPSQDALDQMARELRTAQQ